MHSRIIQLATTPIKKEDFIEHDHVDFDFTRYVDGATLLRSHRYYDFDWLVEMLHATMHDLVKHELGDLSLTFLHGFAETYFDIRFKQLIQLVHKMSVYDFASDLAHTIDDFVENKVGFYVYFEGQIMSLDTFIRSHALPNVPYYVGNTIMYEFPSIEELPSFVD